MAASHGARLLSFVLFAATATCVDKEPPLSPATAAATTASLTTGAITLTPLTAGTNATNLKIYTTAPIAPGPNALITVAVLSKRSGTPLTPTVTGGGMTTWTQVASVDFGTVSAPQSRLVVFRAMSATQPGSGPVTITFSSSMSNATWIISQWDGVDVSGTNGAGAIVQSGSSPSDAASALSTTLGAFADPNDVAFGVVAANLNGPAVTPSAAFTEIAEPTSGESNVLEAEWGLNVSTIGASLTAGKNAAILGIELKASGSGGGGGGGGGGATVSPTLSTVVTDVSSIVAGSGSATITVTVNDLNGQPISGQSVVLSASGSGNTLTQPSSVTGTDGKATGTISSSIAETKTISATANVTGITNKATVTVTPGPVSDSKSTITASPTSIAPGATSTITVTARDANGNPISNATVLLAAGSGNLTQPAGPTNSSGVTTGTLSSAIEETITVSATIETVPITQTATVQVKTQPVVDPLACTGYPEPRIFLESQAWWDSAGLAIPTNVGHHIHVGMCWPVNPDGSDALVDGILHLDVRVLLHNQIGVTNYLRFQDASGTASIKIPLVVGPGDVTTWVPVDLDLGLWGTGRRETHITVNIQNNTDGKRQFNSTGWQLCVRSCTPIYRKGPWTEARGWYEGHDYQNARFLSLLPVAPVSGLWTFNVRLVQTGPGGVFVDPNFHAGIEGTRLADGGYSGNLTVDTRLLANGTHRLVLVASDGKSAGVQLVTFVVAN